MTSFVMTAPSAVYFSSAFLGSITRLLSKTVRFLITESANDESYSVPSVSSFGARIVFSSTAGQTAGYCCFMARSIIPLSRYFIPTSSAVIRSPVPLLELLEERPLI